MVPSAATGLVIFAHGSGSSRFSRRNRAVADVLSEGGFATLLAGSADARGRSRRPAHRSVPLRHRTAGGAGDCGDRLERWSGAQRALAPLAIGCFGASTGAAAALMAAAARPAPRARGDLARRPARSRRRRLAARGGANAAHRRRARRAGDRAERAGPSAAARAGADRDRAGATHLFEEPGALEQVARLALEWCRLYLTTGPSEA